jgi:preprotein translocase subunit SecD
VATAGSVRPGRTLLVLAVIGALLGGWMLVSGVNTPRLGLDLQGGTTVTLQPSVADGATGDITDEAIDQAVQIIQDRVNAFGVSEAEVTAQGSGSEAVIVVSVPGVTQSDLVELVGRTARLSFRPVLQIAAGTPTPQPTPSPSPTKKNPGQQSGQKPEKVSSGSPSPSPTANGAPLPRVDKSGTPSPKASDSPTPAATGSPTPSPSPSASASTPAQPDAALLKQFQELDCSKPAKAGAGVVTDATKPIAACDETGAAKYLLEPVAVDGADIDGASAVLPQNSTSWAVSLSFDGKGTKQFADTTTRLYGQTPPTDQFAIVLDGVVISAPQVNEPILGGTAQITGSFTQQEANDLATVLKYGALPLAFEVGEQQTVSPSLGSDQLRGGLIAGALGLLLVVVYLLVYYRALALVAVASLIIAALLTYGAVVLLGETIGYTLTLAGVAGLIVAIGITADSFIVYFERIRDEVRDGRSLRVALETGWARARRTIVAADFISIIAAVVLYLLSVGGVRGFAFSLGLTTVIDLLVVFMFTKPVISLLARTKFFNSGSKWSGLSPERLGAKARPAPDARRRRTASATKEA